MRNRNDFYRDYPCFKKGHLLDDLAFFAEWFRILRSGKTPLELGLPWITVPAMRFLMEAARPGMKVFEWGCGGSTLFYASRGCEVTAVEHSPEWFAVVEKRLYELQLELCQIEYAPLDENNLVNADKSFSRGAISYRSSNAEFDGKTFFEYATKIEIFPDRCFDLVAIDGRARSSCLRHALNKVKLGGYLLLDNSEREEYLQGIELIPASWSRVHFVGPIVSGQSFGCTTVWKAIQ